MIAIPPNTSIYLHRKPVDFRKGIDALIGFCKYVLDKDPFRGTYFIFYNRSMKYLRILVYDGQGFWLCTKRLSSGTFKKALHLQGGMLRPCELLAVLWNGNPCEIKFSPNWKKYF